jgi:HD-GYP domain-containing protein (c-di-GMP phosphodiesterase class II)
MTVSKIEYPVFTFDRQELLSAGTMLTAKAVSELIAENDIIQESYALFAYGRAKKDLFHFISQPPYDIIFLNQKTNNIVLKNMEKVILPLPLIDALYHFRRIDFYTYRHILMVSALSTLLAEQLISDQQEKAKELIGGTTHDIGKLCVPLDILKKESPLTIEEREILKHHTLAGYVLLCYYFQDAQHFAARVARDHHERKDGSGYPRGIRFHDPMIDIITVSDIYDALISQRPYRTESFENRTALEEITWQAKSGKISIKVVQSLIAVNRAKKPHYSECKISGERRGSAPAKNVYGITDSKNR